MGKRIVVVGAGAVGAYVGGYLSRAGEDVTLIDPWPAHVEQMRAHGLSLEGLSEEKKSQMRKGDELAPGVIEMVKVYVAMKRKL